MSLKRVAVRLGIPFDIKPPCPGAARDATDRAMA
jgi:hypothetical protein